MARSDANLNGEISVVVSRNHLQRAGQSVTLPLARAGPNDRLAVIGVGGLCAVRSWHLFSVCVTGSPQSSQTLPSQPLNSVSEISMLSIERDS